MAILLDAIRRIMFMPYMKRGPSATCDCGTCKKCKHRIYMREYHAAKGSWRPSREVQNQRHREWYARHRDDPDFYKRDKAHKMVYRAVKRGQMERGPCEVGTDCLGRIEAHHDDYDKPLDVRWLCVRHHSQVGAKA